MHTRSVYYELEMPTVTVTFYGFERQFALQSILIRHGVSSNLLERKSVCVCVLFVAYHDSMIRLPRIVNTDFETH